MTTQQRNILGTALYSVLALIFGIVMLIPMLMREIYQYYKYLKPCNLSFELDDVTRYSIFILIFSLFHWCIFDLLNMPIWMMW